MLRKSQVTSVTGITSVSIAPPSAYQPFVMRNTVAEVAHQRADQVACLKAITAWLRRVRRSESSFSPSSMAPGRALSA